MKRWDIEARKREPFLNESPTGLVVFYADHAAKRAADRSRIQELEEEITRRECLRILHVDRIEALEWLVEVLEAYAGRHEWLTHLHGSNDLFVDRVDKHAVWADAQMELAAIASAARAAAGV